jgi:F-box protein 18 (helicase)
VNALESVEASHTFYLTQSFRFGPEIGFAADAFLSTLKAVNGRQTLVGGQKRDSIVSRDDIKIGQKDFKVGCCCFKYCDYVRLCTSSSIF